MHLFKSICTTRFVWLLLYAVIYGWVDFPSACLARPDDAHTQFMDRSDTQPLQLKEAKYSITLPKGQPILVQLETPISTEKNQTNDLLEASLVQDLYMGQEKLFPRMTRFYGKIASIEIPLAGRNPILLLTFHAYQLPGAEAPQPMKAVVRTRRPDHLWGGELTAGTQPKLVRHGVWGIGYYNQVIMTGPRRKGQPITLQPGEMLVLLLEEPLTLRHVVPWIETNPHQPWP